MQWNGEHCSRSMAPGAARTWPLCCCSCALSALCSACSAAAPAESAAACARRLSTSAFRRAASARIAFSPSSTRASSKDCAASDALQPPVGSRHASSQHATGLQKQQVQLPARSVLPFAVLCIRVAGRSSCPAVALLQMRGRWVLTWQHMSSSCSTHSRRERSSRSSGAPAFGWHSMPAGLLAAATVAAAPKQSRSALSEGTMGGASSEQSLRPRL